MSGNPCPVRFARGVMVCKSGHKRRKWESPLETHKEVANAGEIIQYLRENPGAF